MFTKVRLFDNGLDWKEYKLRSAEAIEKYDKSEQCAICLDELAEGQLQVFPCLNHAAHIQCVKEWKQSCKQKNEQS